MFVTIRSYNSCEKADYIKYRLERAGLECKIVAQEAKNQDSKGSYKIDVLSDHIETAVDELLKVHTEYPNENFELKTDPNNLLHILIPIDFSEKSIEACKYAIDIATHRPVEIKLLHIWNDELDDSIAVRSSHMVEDFKRMHRNELKRDINNNLETFRHKLHKLIAETDTKSNLLYHFTIAEGIVQKQIEKAVYRYKPQLILIGHNTNNEYKFRISREVANYIINLAFCPVYYIPQKVFYKGFKELHVMYATNFDKNDKQAFSMLQELSAGYDTHIHYLHVIQEGTGTDENEKMNSLINQLETIKNRDLKIHSDVLSNAKLLNGFESYINDNNIDMISFTSPEYGIWHKLFNPNNLKSIMKEGTIPMLIFRYKDNL